MPRYIDADKIKWNYLPLAALGEHTFAYDFDIANMPAEDVAPIIHAHWIGVEYDGYADGNPVYDVFECSNCDGEHFGEEDTLTAYCPYCGAKMKRR